MTHLMSLQSCMQEKVLRPLLQRFFTRHETQDGGWQWSRSREQARPPVSGADSFSFSIACWDAVCLFRLQCAITKFTPTGACLWRLCVATGP